jgi:hypothetical protein
MKKRMLFLLLLSISAVSLISAGIFINHEPDAISGPTRKQQQSWVYIDLLITDYTSGIPEGHFLYNIVKPFGVASKDMQAVSVKNIAGDFGNVAITYGQNADTLFAGSEVWMGTGAITRPVMPDTNIAEGDHALDKPSYFQFLNTDSTTMDSKYKQKAKLAWAHISKMRILSSYQGVSFKIAFFLYTPAIGQTDLKKAKWIVLLERDAGSW